MSKPTPEQVESATTAMEAIWPMLLAEDGQPISVAASALAKWRVRDCVAQAIADAAEDALAALNEHGICEYGCPFCPAMRAQIRDMGDEIQRLGHDLIRAFKDTGGW